MLENMQAIRKTLVADAKAAVEACAGWNARLAARRITQFLDRRIAPSGLSIAQFGLMAQIAAAEDDTLGALALRLGLDQSTLSRNLRALERDGLVEIAATEHDLRRRAVWLTEKGARQLEAALPLWREAHVAMGELIELDLARKLADETDALVDRSS
jgi:DNA-binding MarR family transcriptional regulator